MIFNYCGWYLLLTSLRELLWVAETSLTVVIVSKRKKLVCMDDSCGVIDWTSNLFFII